MSAQQWVYDLHKAIAHGDDEHRRWLLDAMLAWSEGCPVPEPSGHGRKDAELADLHSALARVTRERDEAVDRVDKAEAQVAALHRQMVADANDARARATAAESALAMTEASLREELRRVREDLAISEREAEVVREAALREAAEREEALRRALGHAYVAQVAEGGESIVRQENDRLHREARKTLADFRDLHVAAVDMVRHLMPTIRGEATEEELNATWNALKQLVAVLEKVSS